jgi:hypothetical protein
MLSSASCPILISIHTTNRLIYFYSHSQRPLSPIALSTFWKVSRS